MTRPSQFDLFDDTTPLAQGSTGLVAVPRGPTPLTKEQKAFNRLAGRVQRLREELRVWQDYGTRYHQRLASELEPVEAAMRAVQRRLVLRLDALLREKARTERLSRAHRAAVREHVVLIAGEILESGPDAEIEALHDEYADATHAQLAKAEFEDLEAMLGAVLGEDAIAGHEARDAEELLRHAHEHAGAQAEAEAQRRAQRGRRQGKGPTRAEQAAAQKAAAREDAQGTVRAIYRRLASVVHPDREADPDARARKTVLMQRANEAYERGDVLTLLELQIALEQIDPEHLASAPPQRLQHFITVLQEQADALNDELENNLAFFRMLLDRPHGRLNPAMVDRSLDQQLLQMRDVTQSIEQDLRHFDDPARRRALLDALIAQSQASALFDDDAFALFDAMMQADLSVGSRPAQRRAKKKRKTRRKKR